MWIVRCPGCGLTYTWLERPQMDRFPFRWCRVCGVILAVVGYLKRPSLVDEANQP